MAKDIRISIRIDQQTNDRLCELMKATGKNKSQIVKMIINDNFDTLVIKDGKKIAEALFNIETLLRSKGLDDCTRIKISQACDLLIEMIYELFTEED